MKANKNILTFLTLGCLLSPVVLASVQGTYSITNNMTGVQMCYSSTNAGGNAPSNTDNIPPGGLVTLSTGAPDYWSGVNYNLRPSNCQCSDTTCGYLGNVNFSVNNTAGILAPVTNGVTVVNFSQSLISSSNASAYQVTGSAPVVLPPPNDQTVTNGTNYIFCNGTANPNSAGVTYGSTNKGPAGTLENGDSVTLSVSTAPYYSGVNFDIRQGGCGTDDAYYGNVNFSTTTDPTTNIASVAVASTGPSTNGAGTINVATTCTPYTGSGAGYGCTVTSVNVTPPAQVSLSTPKAYQNNTGILYRGVNLSGSEFGSYWSPGNVPYPAELNYYVSKGMNTVRMPIRWAYLQPQGAGVGPLDPNYLSFVENVLENLTQAGVYVIVDLHDYQRYAPQGETVGVPAGAPTGSPPNGAINTPTQLASIWTSLIAAFQLDTKIDMSKLIFDISNEPSNMPTADILANENAAIAAIRTAGATSNLILVEGNAFSGLWAWEGTPPNKGTPIFKEIPSAFIFTSKPLKSGTGIVDPSNNYAINVHQYFDSNNSMSGTTSICLPSTDLLTDIQANAFMKWVKANDVKVFVSEFGVGTSSATAGADQTNCMAVITTFLNWVQQNAYVPGSGGFIGWTMWSAGHAWGGYPTGSSYPTYNLDISPNPPYGSSTPKDSPQMQTLLQGGFLS